MEFTPKAQELFQGMVDAVRKEWEALPVEEREPWNSHIHPFWPKFKEAIQEKFREYMMNNKEITKETLVDFHVNVHVPGLCDRFQCFVNSGHYYEEKDHKLTQKMRELVLAYSQRHPGEII